MDWSKALDVAQGDQQLLKEVVEAFLDEYPRRLDQIRAAIRDSKPAEMRIGAHTIKSSLRYLGATCAFDRAYKLECMGIESRFEGADDELELLEIDLDRIKSVLVTFVETGEFEDPAESP